MQSQSPPETALDGKEAEALPSPASSRISYRDLASISSLRTPPGPSSLCSLDPSFNLSIPRLAALEYAKERELTSDCFSLSIRRRLGPVLSLVASSSWIAAQTLRGSHRHCWSLALVADDRRSGLEMLAGFNHVGNCCIGFKKDIGDSGVALRLSTVVLRAMECPPTDLKNCIEIGLEM